MKTNKLFYCATALLMLFGFQVVAQAPLLGTAADFIIFSADGAVSSNATNSLMTHLTGNVGTNTSGGASTGFGNVNGIMQDNNAASNLAAADLLLAYNQLNSLIPNYFPSALLGNGDALNAGTYFISGAAVLESNLILNGQNNPNALFVFQIQGSFSTNALSQITLVNGAKACNVFWKIEGLVDISSGTIMKGTIVANNAAILVGIGSTLEGRLLSTTGAITVNGIDAKLPLGCSTPTLTGPIAPDLASTVCYALFSGGGNVTNAGVTTLKGDVGTNVGVTTGFNALNVTGTIHPIPDASTAQCAVDLLNVRTYLNTLSPDIELLYPAQFGNNLLLTPHTYILNGATVLTDTIFLDGQDNADSVFVIKIYGAFSTSSYANVVLLNGAQAKNVYWIVNGAVDLAVYSQFNGTLVCNNSAINLNTGAVISGRMLTTTGALTTFSMTDNMTIGCATIGIGAVNDVNQKIMVYPNPFSNSFMVEVNENNISSEFTLYDLLGKLVVQKSINQTTTSIQVNVAPGMYFYKFTTPAGLLQTGKLISK